MREYAGDWRPDEDYDAEFSAIDNRDESDYKRCLAIDNYYRTQLRKIWQKAWGEDNYKYLTEFVIVLNEHLWNRYENGDEKVAKKYDELWKEADDFAVRNLKDDELKYFLRVTD